MEDLEEPQDWRAALRRLGLKTADEGISRDEEGNVIVHTPTAQASAAVIVNPTYSDRIGPSCTRCRAPYDSKGVEIGFPPPMDDADPMRICASCIMSFWARGKPFRIDWN